MQSFLIIDPETHEFHEDFVEQIYQDFGVRITTDSKFNVILTKQSRLDRLMRRGAPVRNMHLLEAMVHFMSEVGNIVILLGEDHIPGENYKPTASDKLIRNDHGAFDMTHIKRELKASRD